MQTSRPVSRARRRALAPIACALAAWIAGPPAAQAQSSQGREPAAVTVHASWTQFLGAAVRGIGEDDPKVGGKLTGAAAVDGQRLRLWRGLTINVGAEFVFGSNVNGSGTGAMLPLNTAMMFPANGREDFDLSLNITQRLGASTLTFGKINMLDSVARTPLVGGAGLEGFQIVGLAAPPSELTPPTIFGALWSRPSPRAIVTVGGWDVASALNRTGLSSPFSEGVAGMINVVLPIRTRLGQGFHGVSVMGTTKRGVNLADIGDIFLPQETEVILGEKRGGWHVKYAGQQYLWQDESDPSRGWGVFGQIGAWDANPTPMQWSLMGGVTGSPPIRARPRDRFGIGYFRSSFSRTLRDGLSPLLALEDEQGVEAFYTVEAFPYFRVTGSVQWVDPALGGIDSAVVLGLRTRVAF